MQNELFTYEADGQALIIHLPKELDHHNCRNLKYETDLLMEENYINKIVFDFSNTEFMDSSGVGLLMGRYRAMGMRKESIRATGVSRHIDRLLHLSGLHRYIEIQTAEEEEA